MCRVRNSCRVPVNLSLYIDDDVLLATTEAGARYLMQPSPFAKLLQLATIHPDDTVLDIGCATGYSSAVLARIAGSVVGVENEADLADQARSILPTLGIENVEIVQGALQNGDPGKAPFDVIIIEGSVDQVPGTLFEQLKDGGRLVVVEGAGNAGKSMLYRQKRGNRFRAPRFQFSRQTASWLRKSGGV